MDEVSRKRAKVRVRSVSVLCYLCSKRKRGKRRRKKNNSKCWIFSFHISFLSHHFICPPTPSSPFISLSVFVLSVSLPLFSYPSLLSLSLSRSISCLFMHPNVGNILLSIYRACGLKCVCICVSSLYLCISVHPSVYGCRFFGVFFCDKLKYWSVHCVVYISMFTTWNCSLKETTGQKILACIWINKSIGQLDNWLINQIVFMFHCKGQTEEVKRKGRSEYHKAFISGFKVSDFLCEDYVGFRAV